MQRPVSIALILFFILWILPLGAFIKLDQEEMACNGRRAICLCKHLLNKHQSTTVAKSLMQGGAIPSSKDQASASPDHFDAVRSREENIPAMPALFIKSLPAPTQLFVRLIEHIPNLVLS